MGMVQPSVAQRAKSIEATVHLDSLIAGSIGLMTMASRCLGVDAPEFSKGAGAIMLLASQIYDWLANSMIHH
ncbi:MAG: hypothetical protein EA342_02405 [Leptolyngbya sp. LCM1.Bin17]|nr:MAG: hypothetical protein EA342_02405 [Leptolyngbya sp. LCM1.Bin17]